jgi:hypothetical protein
MLNNSGVFVFRSFFTLLRNLSQNMTGRKKPPTIKAANVTKQVIQIPLFPMRKKSCFSDPFFPENLFFSWRFFWLTGFRYLQPTYQGDQIGRIFAQGVIATLSSFIKIAEVDQIFLPKYKLCMNFYTKMAGLHFGRIFQKLIWSPCYVCMYRSVTKTIGVARFFLVQLAKTEKSTKLPHYIPNSHKICQMAITYSKLP